MFKKLRNYFIKKRLKDYGDNSVNISQALRKANISISGSKNELDLLELKGDGNLSIYVTGNNNKILVNSNFMLLGDVIIFITGNDNIITIGKNVVVYESLKIYCHQNTNKCTVEVGNKTTFYKTEIHNYDNNSSIKIGNDCMFSYNTTLYNSDSHVILKDGKCINKAKEMRVGDHCWIGWDASVLKNSFIAKNTIVGRAALVSGKFEKERSIIAGVPAKIIKEDCDWDRCYINDFLD